MPFTYALFVRNGNILHRHKFWTKYYVIICINASQDFLCASSSASDSNVNHSSNRVRHPYFPIFLLKKRETYGTSYILRQHMIIMCIYCQAKTFIVHHLCACLLFKADDYCPVIFLLSFIVHCVMSFNLYHFPVFSFLSKWFLNALNNHKNYTPDWVEWTDSLPNEEHDYFRLLCFSSSVLSVSLLGQVYSPSLHMYASALTNVVVIGYNIIQL